MPTFASLRWSTWPRTPSEALAAAVFAFLDVVDVLLCLVYALLDGILEESPIGCYCHRSYGSEAADDDDEEVSDTLYARRSAIRDALVGLMGLVVRNRRGAAPCKWRSPRFTDAAGTESETAENAIFVHGFTSSSSFWAETVFRESSVLNSRLFAVDLLGFGQSPKPADCLYRLKDHVEAIETSLVEPLNLSSFHLVAHSMGCIIALALAARHPNRLKSITLVAPPYFLPCEQMASQVALSRLAEKKLWPPLLFGSAVMSWYEHIGRTVCFLLCKNHLLWEWLFRLLTRQRDVDFRVRDLTKHTHHSAWHTMHNVICGGARLQDRNLEAIEAAGIPVMAIHGTKDSVVPVECSRHLKAKIPHAELRLMAGCDHTTVVSGRERGFAEELSAFWSGSRTQRARRRVNGGC
ncbi:hypothetical protein BAE44_0002405 [Dichanthelium oligosanthes]|uniref:AB hydrolase-1 domain-containing protein n=1 Tax=Dichanthelium oligosanthes TaxID=888268 RepID=A0A1E5WGP8_9POAL|nr:hypothetical protein BAE44_0002405 [Dichanthelium oligosanthes]